MASKEQLIETANVLAAELNKTINTDDLKHEELVDLVTDLKAKKKDADTITQADDAPDADDEDTFEEVPPFTVADGKAITSMRGILAEGDEVKAEYLTGGQESLEALVDAKHVQDNS